MAIPEARVMQTNEMTAPKKRVLILGGGFGGLHAALRFERELKRNQNIEVTLISLDNYSLFTPMLHEVATADLDPASIVVPMHKLLRRVNFVSGKISGIDPNEKKVLVQQTAQFEIEDKEDLEIAYDYLLLALGSKTNFFDLPGIEANALTMKTLTDALVWRSAVIGSLEAASIETDTAERSRLMTFVIAGGGFAGVETVGGINDFARSDQSISDFKRKRCARPLDSPERRIAARIQGRTKPLHARQTRETRRRSAA